VIHLGVSCTGIALHRSNKQIDQHVWPNIVKVSYRKRKFRIRYRRARENVEDENPAILMELRCGEPPASKRLWKACVEQHSFFRCVSVCVLYVYVCVHALQNSLSGQSITLKVHSWLGQLHY